LIPQVTLIAVDGTNLAFTGSNLELFAFPVIDIEINGSKSIAIVNSDNRITVSFAGGIPFTNGNAEISVRFKSNNFKSDYLIHSAILSATFSKILEAEAPNTINCSL